MGKLIVLEGIDGSGKGTQALKLIERFRQAGNTAVLFSFPRYGQTVGGRLVQRYLNGEFGELDAVSPWLAALPFALDRLESRGRLYRNLQLNDFVVCDRYVASNYAHQMAKLPETEWEDFHTWLRDLEHRVCQAIRPTLTIQLVVPVKHAVKLIARKAQRTYTDRPADIHEADHAYLERVFRAYEFVANREPYWRQVLCYTPGDPAQELWDVNRVAHAVYVVAGAIPSPVE